MKSGLPLRYLALAGLAMTLNAATLSVPPYAITVSNNETQFFRNQVHP